MNVAINGFGRIGRTVFKLALENKINVVAINDIHGVKDAEYLLKFDSIYGKYNKPVKTQGNYLIVGNKKIPVLNEKDPSKLPWKKLKVNVVVESTGVFRDRAGASKHLKAGAKHVLISAPGKEVDVTIVPGVNSSALQKEHKIISVASCTTNCLAPIIKVLHERFRISNALMTTVHAYTNDQQIHDSPHKKFRRGRAAALNIVPTTTGAAKTVIEIFPELEGKINGLAVRVPVAVGSLVDLTAELEKPFTIEKIKSAFKTASQKELKGILEYSEDELVSSDVIGNPHSTIIDSLPTQTQGNTVKILAWYDNEYGYSNRVIDTIKMLNKRGK
ncbi:MAG: type I glyceraldehyde-3-phosphate dehydrogenase [Nanoarchaeota archaeon]|nr:type I glyceraldehyde-3-phosphate dehydrogenase [Nanoarchaeota archaeon]